MTLNGYGLWVMGLNARSLAICAWLAWRKPNHRLPIQAFKGGIWSQHTVPEIKTMSDLRGRILAEINKIWQNGRRQFIAKDVS